MCVVCVVGERVKRERERERTRERAQFFEVTWKFAEIPLFPFSPSFLSLLSFSIDSSHHTNNASFHFTKRIHQLVFFRYCFEKVKDYSPKSPSCDSISTTFVDDHCFFSTTYSISSEYYLINLYSSIDYFCYFFYFCFCRSIYRCYYSSSSYTTRHH
jgi:hypothetical protein